MRRRIGDIGRLILELEELVGETEEERAQINRWRKEQRSHAAAWLVHHHRAKIRALGGIAFFVPRKQAFPKWFEWAIAELRVRTKTWLVEQEEIRDDGGTSIMGVVAEEREVRMTTSEAAAEKAAIVRRFFAFLNDEVAKLNAGEAEGEKVLGIFALFQGAKAMGFCADLLFAAATEDLKSEDREDLKKILIDQLAPLITEFAAALQVEPKG